MTSSTSRPFSLVLLCAESYLLPASSSGESFAAAARRLSPLQPVLLKHSRLLAPHGSHASTLEKAGFRHSSWPDRSVCVCVTWVLSTSQKP